MSLTAEGEKRELRQTLIVGGPPLLLEVATCSRGANYELAPPGLVEVQRVISAGDGAPAALSLTGRMAGAAVLLLTDGPQKGLSLHLTVTGP